MRQNIYVSSDEVERKYAYDIGYRSVCTHPHEVGVPEISEAVVIDFDHVLFEDQETAIVKANEHARRGGLVGIHTYYAEAIKLYRLVELPNVVVAKTHRRLLVGLHRYARLHRHPLRLAAKTARSLKKEVADMPDTSALFPPSPNSVSNRIAWRRASSQ